MTVIAIVHTTWVVPSILAQAQRERVEYIDQVMAPRLEELRQLYVDLRETQRAIARVEGKLDAMIGERPR